MLVQDAGNRADFILYTPEAIIAATSTAPSPSMEFAVTNLTHPAKNRIESTRTPTQFATVQH